MCDVFDRSKHTKYLELLTDNGDGHLFVSAPIFVFLVCHPTSDVLL